MNRKEENRRLFKIGLMAFLVITGAILVYFMIFNFHKLRELFSAGMHILAPLIYGFVIAYLLLPVYNFITHRAQKLFGKKAATAKGEKRALVAARITGTVVSMLLFFCVVTGFLWMVLPELYRSIVTIIGNSQNYVMGLISWAERLLADNPQIETVVTGFIEKYIGNATSWVQSYILPYFEGLIDSVSTGIFSTVMGTLVFLKNALIGVIAAIYMLNIKETLSAQVKKLVYSILPLHYANAVVDNARFTHRTFGGFISGKLLDSLIIGILCFVVMTILKLPYTVLVSVIVGVTNIIPFFGPFIGAIPSAVLILTVSWVQCIYFVIFVFVLQQFDGNILGPKILGDSTGLSSFWVMFAIITFSGVLGFAGMIVGVPVLAVVFNLVGVLCRRSLTRKELPVDTDDYRGLAHIDEETGLGIPLTERPAPPRQGTIHRITKKFRDRKAHKAAAGKE